MKNPLINRIAAQIPEHKTSVYICQFFLVIAALILFPIFIVLPARTWIPQAIIHGTTIGFVGLLSSLGFMLMAKVTIRHDLKLWPSKIKDMAIYLGGRRLTLDALYTNILVFGGIGTGKTTAVAYPFLDQVSAKYNSEDSTAKDAKWGGLIEDVKGNFHEQLIYILEKNNRDVLKDLVVIRPDNDYYMLEFEDIKTKNRFMVSCMGGVSKQECDSVLGKASPVENLVQKDDNGILSLVLPNGQMEPLSSFLFNDINGAKFKNPAIASALSRLEFNVDGLSVRWLGWREQGNKLRALSHTHKRQEVFKATSDGKPILKDKPTTVRIAGVHCLNNGLSYNLISADAASTEAAARLSAVAEVTGNGLGGDNSFFIQATEKHISMCIELFRQVEEYDYACALEFQDIIRRVGLSATQQADIETIRTALQAKIGEVNAERGLSILNMHNADAGDDGSVNLEYEVWCKTLMNPGSSPRSCSVNDIQKFTVDPECLARYVKRFERVLRVKTERGDSIFELSFLHNVRDYCAKEWANLDQKTKSNIMSCVTNIFGDVPRNPQLLKTFCQQSQFGFTDCLNDGKIYTLLLAGYPNAQGLIGTCMKLDFQAVVQKRMQASPVNKSRLLLFVADEYQFFLTTSSGSKNVGDDKFVSIAREANICNLWLTQGFSSFLAVQKDQNKIDALMQCFGAVFFFRNTNTKTNQFAEEICGQYYREETSTSGPDLKLSTVAGDSRSASVSRSHKRENVWDKSIFPHLDKFQAILYNKEEKGNKSKKVNLQPKQFTDASERSEAVNRYYQGFIENRAHTLGLSHLFDAEQNIRLDSHPAEKEQRSLGVLRSWVSGTLLNKPVVRPVSPAEKTAELPEEVLPQVEVTSEALTDYIENSPVISDLEVSQNSDPTFSKDAVTVSSDIPASDTSEIEAVVSLPIDKGVSTSKNHKANRVVSNIVDLPELPDSPKKPEEESN